MILTFDDSYVFVANLGTEPSPQIDDLSLKGYELVYATSAQISPSPIAASSGQVYRKK